MIMWDPEHFRTTVHTCTDPAHPSTGPTPRGAAPAAGVDLPWRVREAMQPCFVAPSPELQERLDKELVKLRGRSKASLLDSFSLAKEPRALGFNDGMIIPAEEYPFGTPDLVIRSGSADRAPLRGTVRVIVVLVDFSDKQMAAPQQHFRDLFFSTGVIPTGSVKEYFQEATGGLVDITGDVVGPYRMPQTNAWYANGNFGIGKPSGTVRARDMAQDAFDAADPHVNFGPYDNDGNGFVDAFIVVHAGSGGEQTGNSNDIWSHKWTLASAQVTDNTKVFGYLTIPEDARIGVCAHELGHLLFGFPDLYDTDNTSEGVGNWCLMGGGSWNGGGDTPAHPSAWCKVNQGWVSVTNVTQNGNITVNDVKSSKQVFRLWKDGASGQEYFLLENRQLTGYDSRLPGDGLLLWHIDDSKPTNTDENHYKVGLLQADGLRNLEMRTNRGDKGDPFPGSKGVTSVSDTTTPTTKSYTGVDTCVSVTNIPASAASMTVGVTVRCGGIKLKEIKKEAIKELRKEAFKELVKERIKDVKEIKKESFKDSKEFKERQKDFKEIKEGQKDVKEFKEFKEFKEGKEFERPGGFGWPGWPGFGGAGGEEEYASGDPLTDALGVLDQAVAILHAVIDAGAAAAADAATPYIDASLRPDLYGGPTYGGATSDLEKRMAEGDPMAKREFDTPPRA
jgi:immune inhibitor A